MPKFFSLNGMFDSSNSVLAERKVKSCSKERICSNIIKQLLSTHILTNLTILTNKGFVFLVVHRTFPDDSEQAKLD